MGTVFFYRAFATTFPEADRRRYAVLVFLFPSLLFWTADVGKESIMLFALGLTAYGMALALRSRPIGFLYVVLGGALALVIRPDELVILVIGFAIAMLVRAVVRSDHPRAQHPLSMLATLLFVAVAVVVTSLVAAHFVHTLTQSGFSNALTKLSKNNQGTGAGFGSSSVAYSSNPLTYPRDLYSVLFDPLFFSAHSLTQVFASLENVLVLVVTLISIPRLRHVPRACMQRPYVLLALFYSAVFIFAFAALGNLGLITRERTLLLPLLFVVLALPVAREGRRPLSVAAKSKAAVRCDGSGDGRVHAFVRGGIGPRQRRLGQRPGRRMDRGSGGSRDNGVVGVRMGVDDLANRRTVPRGPWLADHGRPLDSLTWTSASDRLHARPGDRRATPRPPQIAP